MFTYKNITDYYYSRFSTIKWEKEVKYLKRERKHFNRLFRINTQDTTFEESNSQRMVEKDVNVTDLIPRFRISIVNIDRQ